MKTLWKAFRKDLKSNNGNIKWELNKWVQHKNELRMCSSGLHASEKVIDAMGYTNLEELALVEVKGKHLERGDKQCWEYMGIVELYEWTKKDSVALSIFAAELILDNYEKQYPNDKRPREAIEAAKKVLKDDSKKNRSAARSAWSAARSAARSAESAVRSARSAARSARSAARSARSAAWSAWSARSAARSAAKQKIINKCEAFVQKRIPKLEKLT